MSVTNTSPCGAKHIITKRNKSAIINYSLQNL
jgi:hypothetical protein